MSIVRAVPSWPHTFSPHVLGFRGLRGFHGFGAYGDCLAYDETGTICLAVDSSGAPSTVPPGYPPLTDSGPYAALPGTGQPTSTPPSTAEQIAAQLALMFGKAGAQSLVTATLPRGYYQQTGPGGTTTIVQPSGVPVGSYPSTLASTLGVGSSGLLVLGIAALAVILFATGRRH